MDIYVYNTLCYVWAPDSDSRWGIIETLTVTDSRWDTKTQSYPTESFFANEEHGFIIFPTGLLNHVHNSLLKKGIQLAYYDYRRMPQTLFQYPEAHLFDGFKAYEDQEHVASLMVEKTRGVLDLATNAGKTYVIALFWLKAQQPTLLVTVPTRPLLYQTAETLEKVLCLSEGSIGRVGDSSATWKPVTVAVINSVDEYIQRHGSTPINFDALIVDEGHVGTAERHQRLALGLNAFYRFWMSGTAYKDGDVFHEYRMTGLAGPCLARISNQTLVEQGRSVYPLIRFYNNKFDQAPGVNDFQGQYSVLKKDPVRNGAIVEGIRLSLEAGLTSLTFCEHIDHIRALHDMTDKSVVHAVTGKDTSKRNNEVRKGLEDGTIRSVICTSTWRMGVSIPGVDVLFQAASYKARSSRIQELGRLLRWTDRGYGWYIDYSDRGLKYPFKWSLKRRNDLVAEGFQVVEVDDYDGLFDLERQLRGQYNGKLISEGFSVADRIAQAHSGD